MSKNAPQVESIEGKDITISWKRAEPPDASYVVEALLNGGWQTVSEVPPCKEEQVRTKLETLPADREVEIRVKAKNEFGETPLHEAAKLGHFSVCELIIKNTKDLNLLTYMFHAHRNGQMEICNLIESAEKDQDETGRQSKRRRRN